MTHESTTLMFTVSNTLAIKAGDLFINGQGFVVARMTIISTVAWWSSESFFQMLAIAFANNSAVGLTFSSSLAPGFEFLRSLRSESIAFIVAPYFSTTFSTAAKEGSYGALAV